MTNDDDGRGARVMLHETGIRIREATKRFKNKTVFYNASLFAQPGQITGVIGHNGSGKTVLFKCICGFMRLSSGTVTVGGKIIGRETNVPKNTGMIIEAPGFLPSASGYHNLKYLAQIQKKIDDEQIRRTMDMVGLDWESKKPVRKYSLGMRQRLGIAQAIMEDPEFLVLDEPMNGLDSGCAENMRGVLKRMKDQGKTVLLSSHDVQDIEMLCDRVYEIDKEVIRLVR